MDWSTFFYGFGLGSCAGAVLMSCVATGATIFAVRLYGPRKEKPAKVAPVVAQPAPPVTPAPTKPKVYACSFCGKSQKQVHRLIAGPDNAFICDECVDLSAEILEEVAAEQAAISWVL